MKHISPKYVQNIWRDQEPTNRHPQPIRESSQGERDDEIREDGRHEHDEGFCCDQVEEEPHYPGEKCKGCRAEVAEPVGDG